MTWPEFESIVKDNCTHYALFFFFFNSKFNKFLETSIMMIEEENMPLNGPIRFGITRTLSGFIFIFFPDKRIELNYPM